MNIPPVFLWQIQFIPRPFRSINFADPADKTRHDRMVTLVTQIPDLRKLIAQYRKNTRQKWRN